MEQIINMSNSLEFCKKRASYPNFSSYSDRDWSKAFESEAIRLVDNMFKGEREYELGATLDNGVKIHYNIKFEINPDGEFDYFTSYSFLSDGTLLFLGEAMDKIIDKVFSLGTYNKELGRPRNGCTVNLTIGNFVILNEYDGDWLSILPEEKKWLRERTTVLLPLRMSYE